MVVWVTGLSGAGKTTLCEALYALLKPVLPQVVRIDGDHIRAVFGGDLGYAEPDRVRQIQRIQGLAKILSDQGLIVLVAALYAHPDLLAWNRTNLDNYFEVYVRAELQLLETRDSKGLYAKARRGEQLDVVGIDIPWHAPRNPDLVIEAAEVPEAQVLARRVAHEIPRFALALEG